MEFLGRHEGCWEAAEINPSKLAPEIARVVPMENQLTARDHVSMIYDKLREDFASGLTKQHFLDEFGGYRKGPASVITKVLVAGVKSPELK